ncbi:transporter-domain-containing protein [Glomus cerebriforme]|uniref:Transporter-domain-containing protein n=1 Tax=Glomus cerebriforme TaxID=658196 RepID=A0A397TKZ2_9GLOM|nr:transporter-domain-containing protein [Glomus cerebriforme]
MSKQNLNLDISYQPLMEDDRPEEEIEQTISTLSSSNPPSPQQPSSRDIEHVNLNEQVLKDKEINTGITLYVYFSAVVVAIGGFLFGYDTGVISSAMLLLEQEFTMSALQKGIIVGAVTLGAVFGGAVAGYLSDWIGRWVTSILSALTFLGGAIVLSIAYTYSLLVIGRLIIGVGVGLASMIVPIYIGEISPRQYRGRLVTLNVLFITGGQVIAYLIGIAFAEFGGWRWMFGVSGIPPLIQLFIMPIIPESPRFLIKQGKNYEAQLILQKIYPTFPQEFIEKEIGIIYDTIAEDELGSYRQLIQRPNLRPLIIACGLQAIQQLSGFDTAMYYGGTIMKMAGFINIKDAIIFSLVVSLTNFLMTGFYFTAGFTTKQQHCEDYGNRCEPCLLDERCGFAKRDDGVCLSRNHKSGLTNIGKVNFFSPSNRENEMTRQDGGNSTDEEFYDKCPSMKPFYTWFTLVCLIVYVMAYALGLGHAPWLIQSEIFPLNIRGRATGIGTATNWLVNLVISVSFLPLTELITTTGTFWLYALFMIYGWFFVYFMVPETAGFSLEEIQKLFH